MGGKKESQPIHINSTWDVWVQSLVDGKTSKKETQWTGDPKGVQLARVKKTAGEKRRWDRRQIRTQEHGVEKAKA